MSKSKPRKPRHPQQAPKAPNAWVRVLPTMPARPAGDQVEYRVGIEGLMARPKHPGVNIEAPGLNPMVTGVPIHPVTGVPIYPVTSGMSQPTPQQARRARLELWDTMAAASEAAMWAQRDPRAMLAAQLGVRTGPRAPMAATVAYKPGPALQAVVDAFQKMGAGPRRAGKIAGATVHAAMVDELHEWTRERWEAAVATLQARTPGLDLRGLLEASQPSLQGAMAAAEVEDLMTGMEGLQSIAYRVAMQAQQAVDKSATHPGRVMSQPGAEDRRAVRISWPMA